MAASRSKIVRGSRQELIQISIVDIFFVDPAVVIASAQHRAPYQLTRDRTPGNDDPPNMPELIGLANKRSALSRPEDVVCVSDLTWHGEALALSGACRFT
jgi:hypothetical protein